MILNTSLSSAEKSFQTVWHFFVMFSLEFIEYTFQNNNNNKLFNTIDVCKERAVCNVSVFKKKMFVGLHSIVDVRWGISGNYLA